MARSSSPPRRRGRKHRCAAALDHLLADYLARPLTLPGIGSDDADEDPGIYTVNLDGRAPWTIVTDDPAGAMDGLSRYEARVADAPVPARHCL